MKINLWGVRGSLPTTGQDTVVFGGNTYCTSVSENGWLLVLDGVTFGSTLSVTCHKSWKPAFCYAKSGPLRRHRRLYPDVTKTGPMPARWRAARRLPHPFDRRTMGLCTVPVLSNRLIPRSGYSRGKRPPF